VFTLPASAQKPLGRTQKPGRCRPCQRHRILRSGAAWVISAPTSVHAATQT
jgi:hypothetical protein